MQSTIDFLTILYIGIPIPLRVAYFLWLVFISLYWFANKYDEYNSSIYNVEKEIIVNFKIFFQLIGVFIVFLNQILLWVDIEPNILLNAGISEVTQPIKEFEENSKIHYEQKYLIFINYILPFIGIIIMLIGLRMAALARAVIDGYWNPNIVKFKNKENHILKQKYIYSKLRHPIYVSQFLLALGTAIAGRSYLLLLFPIIIGIINIRRAKNEDIELEKIFKKEFITYKNKVPACGLGIKLNWHT